MRKRIYSILLAIAMLATIIPITVLAENPPHTHNGYTAISSATELAALFTNGGKGYLTNNITATTGLTVAANVDLCLNDKVLNLDSKGNIAVNAGATFNLYDCGTTVHYYDRDTTTGLWMLNTTKTSGDYTTTGGIITGSTNSGVFVGGTFNMYGGTICGNSANDGGGVFIRENGGTFNMFGGTISGNKAQNCGGGVNNRGMFNMYGGVIEYNSATPETKYTFWGGGGIAIYANGNGTLSGGEIRNNSSTVRGGGILILYGNDTGTKNVSLTGISVINNTATTGGGGIYFDNSNVTVTLGGNTKITDNTSDETKDNFHFDRGTTITIGTGDNAPKSGMSVGITMETPPGQFTTNSATSGDEQYFTSDNNKYKVEYNASGYLELLSGTPVAQIGGTKYTTLKAAIKAAGVVEKITDTNATTIKLLANITNEGVFTIGPEKTLQNIILDLNGFTISDTTATTSLFTIVGHSKLTIDDSSEGKTGAITAKGSTASYLRGFDVARGTLILNNGKISDFNLKGSNSWRGAGVNIWKDTGTFIMNGGEISNCTAPYGGAVNNDGTFIMNNGTITNCTATSTGAGVNNTGDFTMNGGTITNCTTPSWGAGVCTNNSFTMKGGEITNCTAGAGGGGISSNGTLTITGGTISGNTSNGGDGGGGICGANAITIGGTAVITGNTWKNTTNNLYLRTDVNVVLSSPATGMNVGITMLTPPGQFTTTSASSTDTKYFTSDDAAYNVFYNANKYLELAIPRTVSFDMNGHGTAIDSITVPNGSKVTEPTAPSATGYTFGGWYKEAACANAWTFDADTVTANTTLYAKWTINQYTVTFNANGHGTAPEAVVLDYGSVVEKPDDLSATGYTFGGWYTDDTCKTAWNFDSDTITGDITLYAKWTEIPAPEPEPDPEPINYKITQGANSVWVIAADEDPVFRSNADFSKFSHVLLDGKELAKKYYKAESGSTLITLTPEFTSTLAVGKHTIEIVSTDGSASTVFYIEETIANTNGEGFALSTATMSSAFIGCNIVGLAVVFFELKKKKKVR